MYYEAWQKRETAKSGSAIRSSVKVGLLSILDRERMHVSFTIAAKKAQALSCDNFEEVVELVTEVSELDKSLQKIIAISEMIREA